MELEQIRAIIAMMKDNDLSEFSMEQDGLKIRIKRGPEGFQQTVTPQPQPVAAPVLTPTVVVTPAARPVVPGVDIKNIESQMIGTFYRSASHDAPAYVEICV